MLCMYNLHREKKRGEQDRIGEVKKDTGIRSIGHSPPSALQLNP